MTKKPYILKRVIAYMVDILVIAIISSIVSLPFIDNEKYENLSNELMEVTDKYKDKEINAEEFSEDVERFNYEITKVNISQTIAIIIVLILYYVLFNYYNKGQTLGKKLMKLRIVNNDGDKVSINSYIIRMLTASPILSNLSTVVLIFTLSKEKFLIYDDKFSTVFGFVYITCLCFALYRNDGRGLHDLLASTIVVNENDIIKENDEIKEAVIVEENNKKKKDKEVK